MSEEILAAFAAESAENLEGMEEAILEFEKGGEGALDGLFRQVHTIKGSAGIVGLVHLQAFAHAFESRLSALRRHDLEARGKELFSALLACRDHIARLLSAGSPAVGAEGEGELGGGALSELDLEVLESLDASLQAPAAGESGQAGDKLEVEPVASGASGATGPEPGEAPPPASPSPQPASEPAPPAFPREDRPERESEAAEGLPAGEATPSAASKAEAQGGQRKKAAVAGRLVEGFVARVGCTRLLVPLLDVISCEDCRGRMRGRGERRSVDIGGRLVPAIDLRALFCEKAEKGGVEEGAVAMICDSGGERICLIVDEVGEALALEARAFESRLAASPWLAGYALAGVSGAAESEGESAEILLILDVEGTISSFAN